MDSFEILLQAGLITSALVVYMFLRRSMPKHKNYKDAGWNYPIKLLFARYVVRGWKAQLAHCTVSEEPRAEQREGWDSITLRTTAPDGTAVLLGIRKLCERQPLVETTVFVKLPDGTTYVLPQSPEAAVGAWESSPSGWSANGLKIQILKPGLRMRVLYNGLLTKEKDSKVHHVTLNLTWVSATAAVQHPKDWSNHLAAQALAFGPWQDSNWSNMLDNWKDGGWVQFGAMQGRFISYDDQGTIDRSEYFTTRGILTREWAPHGYQALRRVVEINVATSDGTLVQMKCLSYKDVLTQVISGSVRFPNFSVENITSTDLTMSDFCERPEEIPKSYTINVSTSTQELRVTLGINADGGKYYSGVPFQHETVFRTVTVKIGGYSGTGILELGYESTVSRDPTRISRPRLLKWLSTEEAGPVGYCATFPERAAACPDHVGGKCASLALLASMQKEEGYRVPPGFCVTVKAMEKHLEQNPELKAAIKEIEAANEKYEENNFKAKCDKASSLFAATEIGGEVKAEILENMADLRKKALEENLGPDLRFAVRSSAVGEDSEVLSAAGQNETILGCATDEDVLRGVQKCWGSMFAFTSAYYRRSDGKRPDGLTLVPWKHGRCLVWDATCVNTVAASHLVRTVRVRSLAKHGQACACAGAAAVQALVAARAAGVLFSRHPAAGDARRLLLTANYGLGESVVSGAVEPDTFIISRSLHGSSMDDLHISQTILGEKKQRVVVVGERVNMVDVPESERKQACLTDSEVLRLARVGVLQEELWGAPRDIEWALAGEEIFLLQARPITSLERWTEEELLHEMDCPIMSDDELITFANTGEVLPRPLSPMTNDVVIVPLSKGIDAVVGKPPGNYDHSLVTTHQRCAIALYNSVYRQVPKEIDINIRMIEFAVHGHKVADDDILATALHRNKPRWLYKPQTILQMIKVLLISKRYMKNIIRDANAMTVEAADSPQALLDAIAATEDTLTRFAYYHSVTTAASTFSQFVAMNVLLEGRSDFSNESCNEIGALLSSGEVLSAEVPTSLSRLARMLEASGHYDQFRAQHPTEAMKWLKQCLPQIYLEVCNFLERHGHRAIMEFDVATKPWVLVPEEMMKVLQNLRTSRDDSIKSKTDAEIIDSLKTPQKSSTRKVLRWVMPLCRRTVRHRETTKAHLILAIHKIRLAFLRLGKLMVKEWYLPHQDLVFFFTFQELRSYINTRDPALLRKASQRHQYYPSWCKLKFAELNKGWLTPLQTQGPLVSSADVKIEAASVCGGEVLARACVVKDLSEIGELQQGDVLITHATDIGWSPYFPLLAGIVTELGGLISHGAVIAREYGLPCIVGATNATDIFKTGDHVRLSGTRGTLERVQLQENSKQNGHKEN